MPWIDRAAAEAALLNAHFGVVCLSGLICQDECFVLLLRNASQTLEYLLL
jgi:hypothetical protein